MYRRAVVLALPVLVLLLLPTPFIPFGMVGVLLVLSLRWVALGSPLPVTRVNPVVLVLLLTVIWGMLRAPYLIETTLTVARLLAGILVMALVADYAERPSRLWNVAAALVLFGLAVAFAAPFITQPTQEKFIDVAWLFNAQLPHWYDLSNPNMVAGALAALLPLALALGLSETRGLRLVGSVAFLPMLIMLLLLQARGGLLAAVLGLCVFGVLYKRWLSVLVPFAALALLAANNLAVNLNPDVPDARVNLSRALLSLEGRQQVWQFAAEEIAAQPLGIGINAFSRYADALMGDVLAIPQRQNAHNLFLQVGLETGLLGLTAFAVLLAYCLFASWHAYRREVKRTLAIGVLSAVVVVMAQGLFENNMWGNKSAIILWAIVGMCAVLGRFGARRGVRRTTMAS